MAAATQNTGVCFSGMQDHKSWTIPPELQAKIDAETLKVKARQEAEVLAYAKARAARKVA